MLLATCLSDAVRDSWIGRAESVFNQCISHPGVFAFLLDQWSLLLEAQQAPATPPAATAGPVGASGLHAVPHIPAPMLDWMHEKVNVSDNSRNLLEQVQAASQHMQASEQAKQKRCTICGHVLRVQNRAHKLVQALSTSRP